MKLDDLFEHDGWDELDTMAFVFYNCVLKQTIGKFKAGMRVSDIAVNFDTGTFQITPTDTASEVEFSLGYTFKEVQK